MLIGNYIYIYSKSTQMSSFGMTQRVVNHGQALRVLLSFVVDVRVECKRRHIAIFHTAHIVLFEHIVSKRLQIHLGGKREREKKKNTHGFQSFESQQKTLNSRLFYCILFFFVLRKIRIQKKKREFPDNFLLCLKI